MSDSLQQCQTFLAAIFEPDDVIEIRCLKPAAKHWCTPADFADLNSKLQQLNAAGKHIYFGGNPRKAAGGSKEEDVALARCVFADFDGGTTADEALSQIEAAGLPTPTATINSGGGIHAWWRLTEPMTDARQWNTLQKRLAEVLESDAAGTSGWPRIMRLPGFVNHKYPHKPVAKLIEADASRVFPLATLTPFLKPMGTATRAFIAEGVITDGGRRETMFRAACDLRDHGWTPDAAEAVLMRRMETFSDLSSEDIADCPRQIRNAWKRDARPVSTATARPTARRKPPVPPWRPFPTRALPRAAAALVEEAGRAIGCDEAFVALPLLAVLGSAIGTTRRVGLKSGWTPLPIVWPVTVAESGSAKSPAADVSLDHVREREDRLQEEYIEELAAYENEVEAYEKARNAWRRSKHADEDPPVRPREPLQRCVLIEDATIEALVAALADNPRGLLMATDELAGWLDAFGRYNGNPGSDEAFFLKAYSGRSHNKKRQTGRRSVYVRQAAVWVTGTIQPGVLARSLGVARRENGFLARLLLAAPPRRPKKWTNDSVSSSTLAKWQRVLNNLYSLEPELTDGRERSRIVRFSRDAEKIYVKYFYEHDAETLQYSGDLAAAWSKLEETAARLALIVHETRIAAGERLNTGEIDAASMAAGIELVSWFKFETQRVYRLLAESKEDRDLRQIDDKVEELIRRKGGSAYPRDLISGLRVIPDTETAEATLTRLVAAGRGRWHNVRPTDTGGRPARRFELMPSAEPTELPEFSSCACADSSEEPETEYVEL